MTEAIAINFSLISGHGYKINLWKTSVIHKKTKQKNMILQPVNTCSTKKLRGYSEARPQVDKKPLVYNFIH